MFRDRRLALVAAALFALHPIHSESVAWVAAVTDPEVTLFYLLGFWFFLGLARAGGGSSLAAHFGMTVSFVLALLSKEHALTFPLLATVYEHFYRSDRAETTGAQKLARYASLWALGLLYLAWRRHVLGTFARTIWHASLGYGGVLLSAVALIGQYVWKLFWPAHLSAFYVFPNQLRSLVPAMIGGVAALLLGGWLFAVLWKRDQLVSFGLIWFLVTLAPVLNVHWLGANAFTERYLYLPSVGFSWVAAWACLRLFAFARRRSPAWEKAVFALLVIMAALSGFRIVTRNRDWHDDETLFTRTLADAPDAGIMHENLGLIYFNRGDVDRASREWLQAVRLSPNDPELLAHLGLMSARLKRYDEALGYFRGSLRLAPNNTDTHVNLGITYHEMGMDSSAEAELRAAIALAPLDYRAHSRLGDLYYDEGRLAEAEAEFLQSNSAVVTPHAYILLGDIAMRRGEHEEAEQLFMQALSLEPNAARGHFALGFFYANVGRAAEAIAELQKGLEFEPDNQHALAALRTLRSRLVNTQAGKH
jgi:tetratricopeptide (TPR) repeat protein